MQTVKAEETAEKYVDHIIALFGLQKVLISDRGSNFLSKLFQEVLKLLGIQHIPVCSFNPKANGTIERVHATIFNSISHFINKAGDNWEDILHLAKASYNSTPLDNLGGHTPHFLQFGGQPFQLPFAEILRPRRVPYNLDENFPERLMLQWQKAMKLAEEATQKFKEKAIARRNIKAKPVRFHCGALVYLKNKVLPQNQCKKWNLKFLGPYIISRQLSPVNFEIKAVFKRDVQIVNADRLKLARKAEGASTAIARDKIYQALCKKQKSQEEKVEGEQEKPKSEKGDKENLKVQGQKETEKPKKERIGRVTRAAKEQEERDNQELEPVEFLIFSDEESETEVMEDRERRDESDSDTDEYQSESSQENNQSHASQESNNSSSSASSSSAENNEGEGEGENSGEGSDSGEDGNQERREQNGNPRYELRNRPRVNYGQYM